MRLVEFFFFYREIAEGEVRMSVNSASRSSDD